MKKEISSSSRIGTGFLILFAVLYCFSALRAPFWNDNDTWSNLLPIIHYRQSILIQHQLPLYTNLWYGGTYQWADPLWSFLYLPATIVWLSVPLDWGARIVFLGHLIFALLTARMLASLVLEKEFERVAAALILTSPLLPALQAGHVEKVMSWGWIMLSLYFLLNTDLTPKQRGIGSGVCLGIVPLTGANYYALYAAILLLSLVWSYQDRRLSAFFVLGSTIGLLHLPAVWQLVGYHRIHAKFYIGANSSSFTNVILSVSEGMTKKTTWETWAPIGIPTIYLLVRILGSAFRNLFCQSAIKPSRQSSALLLSIVVFTLLATGLAYKGNNLLDSFRMPVRAMAFIALGSALFVLVNIQFLKSNNSLNQTAISMLLFASATQIAVTSWQIRPQGSIHSPYELSVQSLAEILKADGAKSVWFSAQDLGYMYIHVGLTRNNISLPVVYYGEMGQKIEIKGNYCGYSFDHLITPSSPDGPFLTLNADVEWSHTTGEIPMDRLSLIKRLKLGDEEFNVYRVNCT